YTTRCRSYIKLLPDPVGRTAKTSFRSTNALIAFLCSSFKMNALSMNSLKQTLHISTLQRQPCLLKTNSTQALFGDVVDYITDHHRIKPTLTILFVRTIFFFVTVSPLSS